MAHQEDDITLFPSFIEAPHTSPHSPSNQQKDLHRTLQGFPLASTRDSPKVMVLVGLMTLVLRTKSIGQWPFTFIDGTLEYL
jgi:hypothetical protein